MKILAFVDTHGYAKAITELKRKVKVHQPDLIICAGDISIFEQNIKKKVSELARLDKLLLLVHGNHESETVLKRISKMYKNLVFLHKQTYRKDNFVFLGYGGGGFSIKDKEFEKKAKMLMTGTSKKDKIILITHGPPFNTKLDLIDKQHVGNKSYRKFIENNNVELVLCGHLHENFDAVDVINKTKIINPGPFGQIITI